MSLLTLRHLSYWTLVGCIGVGCAASENNAPKKGHGGTSNNEAGAPDAGESGKDGGSGGSSGSGAATAGSNTAESGNAGMAGGETAGTAGTGMAGSAGSGGSAGGGTDAGGAAGTAGSAGTAGVGGAGGALPDPGCKTELDCDDKNPCTTDSCVDTLCKHDNNTEKCKDDADDCTDDVCKDGACTHPANTAACEDDNDNCTTDVCAGDICTHPSNNTCKCFKAADCNDMNPCTTDACVGNQCQYTNNTALCTDDANGCTDDVCKDGACSHQNNTDSCTDDGNACTTDLCANGACGHSKVVGCCSGPGDCYDGNACTDDTCENRICNNAANTSACDADASPCSGEICANKACTHPNNAVCAGSDDVIILVNRTGGYVVMDGVTTYLGYAGATPGTAAVFSKVGEVGTKFKLKEKASGKFVVLDPTTDALMATGASEATATAFDAAVCGAPWVGLNATNDDDGNSFVQAGNGNRLIAANGNCPAASATAWEKFQFVSVTRPCSAPADCDDSNVCTDDSCGMNGFCAYVDHVGTCDTDGSACTDDVCTTGTCTHPGNGTCTGPLYAIQPNRDTSKYVTVNAGTSYLEYTASAVTTTEKFELVDKIGTSTQFKLRASNSMFVTLDGATDNLIANASFAGAMLFDSTTCGAKANLIAVNDDEANKYIYAAAPRLIADKANCSATGGSWEQFTLVAQ